MLDVLKTFYRGTGDREQGFRFHIRVCYVTYDIVTDKGGDRTELLIFYAQERSSAEGYWNVEVGDKEIFGNSVVLRDGNTEILRNRIRKLLIHTPARRILMREVFLPVMAEFAAEIRV